MTPLRRICFVSTGLGRGGAEAQLFRAACGLRHRGFDVHVVSILRNDYYGARLEAEGIPVTCLDAVPTTNPALILSRFLRRVLPLAPHALAGFDYPGTMLARVGGAVARVPVVISSIRSEKIGSRFRALALQWTDSLANVTTTNSDRVARHLVRAGAVSGHRVRVIPNGLDLEAIGPHLRVHRAALRQSLGVAEDEFLWVAVGRLYEPKDYPNLLSAVSRLTHHTAMKVAIAGQGPLLAQIESRIADLSLDERVTLLGLRDDAAACMAAADATVLASAWEGSPNAVIESLAVGTPVVSTDVGGVREIVDDGHTGFIVPPRDPDALAAAMSKLMARSAAERSRMGNAGRAHIEGRFGLDRVLDRWFDLFNGLMEHAA